MSASQHAWHAAGRPDHGYASSDAGGPCATCAAPLASGAVALSEIETPTTANHADLFRFGARHVCPACAWLYAAGKGRPGNYLVTGDHIEYLVISVDSVVTGINSRSPSAVTLRPASARSPLPQAAFRHIRMSTTPCQASGFL